MVFSHTSAVRTVYAMARDGALPFSDALSRTTSWGMPIAANAAAFVAEVGFILLNLNHQPEVAWSGATVAFNASTAVRDNKSGSGSGETLNLNPTPAVSHAPSHPPAQYSIMGYYLSYFVPILLRHTSARSTFVPTPDFSLGRASLPMACISLVWIVFIVLVSSAPSRARGSPYGAHSAPSVAAGLPDQQVRVSLRESIAG